MAIRTRRLSDDAFKATFVPPMRDVTGMPTGVPEVWPYIESIPKADFGKQTLPEQKISAIYMSSDHRYAHVLVSTQSEGVYLAIVVDFRKENPDIMGHHLLDLNAQ